MASQVSGSAGRASKWGLLVVLMIVGAIGFLILGGILASFFLLEGPGNPEKLIVGEWEYQRGDAGMNMGWIIEFKPDGTFLRFDKDSDVEYAGGSWKAVGQNGKAMSVEIGFFRIPPGFQGMKSETRHTFNVTIPSRNELLLRSAGNALGDGARYQRK